MGKQFSPTTRKKIFIQNNKCEMCGRLLQIDDFLADNYLQIDHLVAKTKGGKSNFSNLRGLCRPCNASKGNRTSLDFLYTIENSVKRINPTIINNIKAYEAKNGIFDKKIYDAKLNQIITLFLKTAKEPSDD